MATVMRDQLGKVNWNGELLDHENEDVLSTKLKV